MGSETRTLCSGSRERYGTTTNAFSRRSPSARRCSSGIELRHTTEASSFKDERPMPTAWGGLGKRSGKERREGRRRRRRPKFQSKHQSSSSTSLPFLPFFAVFSHFGSNLSLFLSPPLLPSPLALPLLVRPNSLDSPFLSRHRLRSSRLYPTVVMSIAASVPHE